MTTTTAPASISAGFAAVDGYWTPDRLNIWRGLTPEQRDYDRYQGWYPPGQGVCETVAGAAEIARRDAEADEAEHECRCHISPPCWHCTDCVDCTEGATP